MKKSKILLAFFILLISCKSNHQNSPQIIQTQKITKLKVLTQRGEPKFILDESNQELEQYIYQNLGYFYLVTHDQFDSLNTELKLNLKDRSDFNDLSHIEQHKLEELIVRLKLNLVQEIPIESKSTGKYLFKLNPQFWKNTYNGDSYIEMIQDHGLDQLTKFNLFDKYSTCLTAALLTIDQHTSRNRVNCENFASNLKSTSINNSLIDENCFNTFFNNPSFQFINSNLIHELDIFYEKSKDKIESLDRLFKTMNEPPFHILRI